jgi:Spx/MgsR family transcriptional regulator
MIKLYGIKNCDSVKKAIKFLTNHNLEYQLYDFKQQPALCEDIDYWIEKTDIKTLFNARSTTYRNLKLKELNLDDTQKAQWLCKENMLIKRPILNFKDKILVGFNEDSYKEFLL